MVSIRREQNRNQGSFLPGLERLGEQMVSLYGAAPREPATESFTATDWSPMVNVIESDSAYLIEAELPGTTADDVGLRLDGNILTLEGERRHEEREEGSRSLRIECTYGCFLRRFALPPDAIKERISASHRDGILRISIPRETGNVAADRRIPVSAG